MIRRLLVNTGSNVLVMFNKIIVTLIMTPIYISSLGAYDYGLWEMVASVIGYMGMLDLGIRPAISRFAAHYKALDDRDNLEKVYSSVLVFMVLIGVLLLCFFTVWSLWFSNLLAPNGQSAERYSIFLLIIGLQLLIAFPGYVAESYLEGFEQYYVKNNVTMLNTIAGAIILYNYITPENGLLMLALVSALGIAIKYLFYFYLLSRPMNQAIQFKRKNFSWVKLKEIISFGLKSFVQGIASRIETASDVLIIGFFLGPAVVPFYSVPSSLAGYLRGFGWTITHAFMPLFSGMNALGKNEEMKGVYLSASRYAVGLLLPLGVGLSVIGGPFLALWLGSEFREKGEIIIYCSVAYVLLPFLVPFTSRYLTAIGKHGFLAKVAPVGALINIILSLLLVGIYGAVGVAAASVAAVLMIVPFYLVYTCNCLGISIWIYIRMVIIPCLIPPLIMGAYILSLEFYWQIDTYFKMIVTIFTAGSVWLCFFWSLTLNRNEKDFIKNKIKKSVNY